MLKSLIAGTAAALIATTALAADFKPAVVFDMGGKFDKSFNEGVWNGVEKFMKETGIKVMEFEVTNEAQREQAMRRMVVVRRLSWASVSRKPMRSMRSPRTIRKSSSPLSTSAGSTGRTCANMPSAKTKAAILLVLRRPRPRRPARLDSSAAWTSR